MRTRGSASEDSYRNGRASDPLAQNFALKLADRWTGADSEGWRSAFRTDVDHDSEVMPISVPN